MLNALQEVEEEKSGSAKGRSNKKKTKKSASEHPVVASPIQPCWMLPLMSCLLPSQIMLVPSLFRHRPATVWFDYCSKYGERLLDVDLVTCPHPPSKIYQPPSLAWNSRGWRERRPEPLLRCCGSVLK